MVNIKDGEEKSKYKLDRVIKGVNERRKIKKKMMKFVNDICKVIIFFSITYS